MRSPPAEGRVVCAEVFRRSAIVNGRVVAGRPNDSVPLRHRRHTAGYGHYQWTAIENRSSFTSLREEPVAEPSFHQMENGSHSIPVSREYPKFYVVPFHRRARNGRFQRTVAFNRSGAAMGGSSFRLQLRIMAAMCASEMLSRSELPAHFPDQYRSNSTTSLYVAFGDGQRFVAMVPVERTSRRSLIGQAFSRSEKLNLKPIPEQFFAARPCKTTMYN